MASNLYNYLNTIDKSRQDMIRILNENGATLEPDTSFSTLSSSLDNITRNRPSTELQDEITYYNNPEDDPLVWKRPKIYTQIDEIWNNIKPYTNETYNTPMYPAYMYVLKTNLDTLQFLRQNNKLCSKLDVNPLENNAITIHQKRSDTYANASINYAVHTNDGSVYNYNSYADKNDATVISHTFDSSKDLVDEDGIHYKYLICYSSLLEDTNPEKSFNDINSSSFGQVPIYGINAGDDIEIPYAVVNPSFVYYSTPIGNNTTKLYWLKFSDIPTRLSEDEVANLPSHHAFKHYRLLRGSVGSSSNYSTGGWPKYLQRFEIDIPTYVTVYDNQDYPLYMHNTFLNTFISSRDISKDLVGNSTNRATELYALPNCLVYLKGRRIHPSALAQCLDSYDTTSAPATSQTNIFMWHNTLKYLEYTATDAEQEDYAHLTSMMVVETDDSNNRRAYHYPNLPVSKLYPIIKYVYHLCYFNAYDDGTYDMLTFPNVQTANLYLHDVMAGQYKYNLMLPGITGQYKSSNTGYTPYKFYARNLYLPNLNNPTTTIMVTVNGGVSFASLENMNNQTLTIYTPTKIVSAPRLRVETCKSGIPCCNSIRDFEYSPESSIVPGETITWTTISLNTRFPSEKMLKAVDDMLKSHPSGASSIPFYPNSRCYVFRYAPGYMKDFFDSLESKGYRINGSSAW